MKTIKFFPNLVPKILTGEKTTTWRLFDDKDLREGDALTFVNTQTGEAFGTAVIVSFQIKTLSTLSDEDWADHERPKTEQELYQSFSEWYGGKDVGPDTEVKILTFSFKKNIFPYHECVLDSYYFWSF